MSDTRHMFRCLLCLALVAVALPAQADRLSTLADALLRDGSHKVRIKAARALAAEGSPQAVHPLIFALRDDHPLVRAAAAHALGERADPRALRPLCALRADRDPFVRRTVDTSLAALGGPAACDAGQAVRVRITVTADTPARQVAVQAQLEAMTRARAGLELIEGAQDGQGIELMVKASSGVKQVGGQTSVTCAMSQSVFDLPQRALRGTAHPTAEVPLGTDASPSLIEGSAQQCLDALAGAVFEELVAYAKRR